jgi:hypothetical protein
MEPREAEKRETPKSPEAREAEPRPRRFRIVKLEERIAPRLSTPQTRSCGFDCGQCTIPDSGCF